jgi:hypothetical protein
MIAAEETKLAAESRPFKSEQQLQVGRLASLSWDALDQATRLARGEAERGLKTRNLDPTSGWEDIRTKDRKPENTPDKPVSFALGKDKLKDWGL